jgi:microcin C transport system ATP-binding protein
VSFDIKRKGETRGAGRRVRFRQIGHALSILKLLPYPAARIRPAAFSSRAANCSTMPEREIRKHARQRHFDHLPGADDLAQSAAHDREADRRDPAAAQRPSRQSAARARTLELLTQVGIPDPETSGWRAIRINCPAASASAS